MKNYEEITNDLLERRDRYVVQQKLKRKKGLHVVASLCCVCIVALFGFGVWQSGEFDTAPPMILVDPSVSVEKEPSGSDNSGQGNGAQNTIPQKTETTHSDETSPTESTTATSIDNSITTTTTLFISEEVIIDIDSHTTTAAPIVVPDDEATLYKYYDYYVDNGAFSSYMNGKVINESKLGNKLDEVTVTAGWKATDGTWLSKEYLRAELYSITGVASDVAVALKFLDKGEAITTSHYYVIMNPVADLSSVEDYVIDPIAPNASGEELTGAMVVPE
ncbi:MAG: hypothetical protein E7553_05840 [Ruminococcaceae bacterium]|nr:hypothetical protein [Oscillospiraceae bacterium]